MALGDQLNRREGAGIILGPRLAEGGMAEVFAAQLVGSEGFTKDIVVKRVLPQLARDPEFIARFIDEARLAAQLNHPAIAQVLQLVVDGDDLMMAIELVDGADLSTLLKRSKQAQKKMALPLALRVMTAVAGALAYAHEKRGRDNQPLGIIHRDVTPSNILVSRDGATKLIDFGIARANSAARVTRRGSIVGKLHYLSPEQVRDGPVDARADLWAFGVVLFQILTGTRPFHATDDRAVFEKIVSGARADVRQAGVPDNLALVVDGCLTVDVDKRIPSARVLERALEDVIAQNRLHASASELGAFVSELVPPIDVAPPVRADGREATAEATAEASAVSAALSSTQEELASTELSTIPSRRPKRASLTLDVDEGDDATLTLTADVTGSTAHEAATQILPERQRRRRSRAPLAVVAGAGVAALVAALAIVLTGPAEREPALDLAPVVPTRGAAAEQATAPTTPRTPPAAPPPAAPPSSAPLARDVVDEGAAAEPARSRQKRVGPKTHAKAAEEREEPRAAPVSVVDDVGEGTLIVDARPWAQVTIDGVDVGITPVAARTVKAGPHTVVLENREQGLKRTVTALVTKGRLTTTRVDLRR